MSSRCRMKLVLRPIIGSAHCFYCIYIWTVIYLKHTGVDVIFFLCALFFFFFSNHQEIIFEVYCTH